MISAPPSATDDFIPPQFYKLAPCFALIAAVLLAYGNVYDNAFVDDDKVLILQNVFLRDWHHIAALFSTTITAGAGIGGGMYRPLQMLVYLVIYQLCGPSLFAFHALNVALHAANACLIYRLGVRLRFDGRAAFFAALLWGLHPVHTEVIAYVSGTADPLFVLFCLIGLLIALPDFTPHKCMASLPFFILGMLSKEEAVMFPLLAMSCLFLLEDKRLRPETYFRTWPLLVAAILYALAHRFLLSFGDFPFYPPGLPYSSSILCRIYTCLATLPAYLGFLVWPTHLHFGRNLFPVLNPLNLPTIEGFVLVALAAMQIALARSRSAKALSWSLLWFAAAHLLHTGILVPLNSMILEHWLYLPSAGLFLGADEALICCAWPERKIVFVPVALLLAVIFGVLTWNQNIIWRDEEIFYLNIFRNGEPSLESHDNLGSVYTERGEYGKAIAQFQNVIDLSHDRNAAAEYNLAVALLLQKNDTIEAIPEAISHMERALEIEPDLYPASEKLAILYERLGNKQRAAFYRDKASAIRDKLTHSTQ